MVRFYVAQKLLRSDRTKWPHQNGHCELQCVDDILEFVGGCTSQYDIYSL